MVEKLIYVRYAARPDWPDSSSHKCTNLMRMTRNRTRKFNLNQYEEAWNFLMECTAPITKLSSLLFAFPKQEALKRLEALNELTQSHKSKLDCVELKTRHILTN